MSDVSMGDGWWQASDGKWYPPELHPDRATPPPPPPVQSPPAGSVSGGRPGSARRLPLTPPSTGPAPGAPGLGVPVLGQPPRQPSAQSSPMYTPLPPVSEGVGRRSVPMGWAPARTSLPPPQFVGGRRGGVARPRSGGGNLILALLVAVAAGGVIYFTTRNWYVVLASRNGHPATLYGISPMGLLAKGFGSWRLGVLILAGATGALALVGLVLYVNGRWARPVCWTIRGLALLTVAAVVVTLTQRVPATSSAESKLVTAYRTSGYVVHYSVGNASWFGLGCAIAALVLTLFLKSRVT